eukprot:gene15844-biopygen24864
MTCIPALKVLPSLNELRVTSDYGEKLHSISALSKCSNLHTLDLTGGIRDIAALSECSNLRTLTLSSNELQDISALSECSNLHTLKLCADRVKDIDALSSCSNLHSLTLRIDALEDATALSRCLNLHVLDLMACRDLVNIALSSSLQSLKMDAAHVGALSACPHLSALELRTLPWADHDLDLSPLSACTNLHELSTYGLNLQGIAGLFTCLNLVNLNELHLDAVEDDEMHGRVDISALSTCTNLHKLSLSSFPHLEDKDIKALSSCSNLCALNLSWNSDITSIKALSQGWSIAVLSSCANLHTLSLADCQHLKDKNIQVLSSCPNLTSLNLSDMALDNTKAVSECSKLSVLCLASCTRLADISDLKKCRYLRKLDLFGCERVQDLTALSGCSNLRKLGLTGLQQGQSGPRGTRRTVLGPGDPVPKRSKAHDPWTDRLRKASGSQAPVPIEAGPAAEMLWNIREALLPSFDPATLRALRLVCKLTCKAVAANARCLTSEGPLQIGSDSREVYNGASQTVFPKCPNLDKVKGHYPHTYLALAELPTHFTSLEIKHTWTFPSLAEFQRNAGVLRKTDLSPLTALTRLEKAVLEGLPASKIAGLDFGNALRSLGLHRSTARIPALKVLPSLNELRVTSNYGCKVTDISALAECSNLHILTLSSDELQDISALSECSNLHTLTLSSDELQDISALSECSNLHTLDLCADRVQNIDALSSCSNLHSLTLCTDGLKDATALSRCLNLHVLDLHAPFYSGDLVNIALSSSLQSLKIDAAHLGALSACPNLSALELRTHYDPWAGDGLDLSPLSACMNLHELSTQSLDLRGIAAVFTCLNLVNLNELHLHAVDDDDMHGRGDISALSTCTNLHTLSLSDFPHLEDKDIKALSSCSNLCALNLSRNYDLTSIKALLQCTNLHTLDLSDCVRLDEVKALSKLSKLNSLDLSGCVQLKSIAVLSSCVHLHTLSLADCQNLTDKNIQALSSCPNLTSLNLSDMALENTKALSECSKLSVLCLASCTRLADISDLTKCRHLCELDLFDCERVQDLTALSECSNLRKLDLDGLQQGQSGPRGIAALLANIQVRFKW